MNSVVAIAVSSFLCITALARPDVGIRWIFLTAILVVGTVDYFFPQYSNVGWGVAASGSFLIIISLFYFLNNRNTSLDRISLSMIFFAVFLFVPIATNIDNPFQIIAYGKNIVQFWGFVLLATLGFLHSKSRGEIKKLVIIIVIIQAVVSAYQGFFIVDWGTRVAGGDSVVGTFGGTPDAGGSSGAQTIFLSVIISITLAAYISGQVRMKFLLSFLIINLIPISLNQTKVFFVLIPIAVTYFFITGFNRFPARTLQVFAIGLGLVLFIFIMYFVYLQDISAGEKSETVSEYADRMQSSSNGFYVGEGRDASESRLGSVVFWWVEQINNDYILELFIGHGLGASKSGGVFPGKLSSMDSPYRGLMLDRTGLSSLLWDLGIIGTVLFYSIFVSGWSLARKIRRFSKLSDYEKSIMWGVECGIILLALSNIYDKYFFTNTGLNAFTLFVLAFVVGVKTSTYSDLSRNNMK